MNTVPTTISKHVFINSNFLYFYSRRARGFQRRPFESSKNLIEMHFFWGFSKSNADHGVDGILQHSANWISKPSEFSPHRRALRSLLADHLRINGGYRLLPSQCLYRHWLRSRRRYIPLRAGEARVPIPAHLAARVHSSGRRSRSHRLASCRWSRWQCQSSRRSLARDRLALRSHQNDRAMDQGRAR